jgi:hypothetical protein
MDGGACQLRWLSCQADVASPLYDDLFTDFTNPLVLNRQQAWKQSNTLSSQDQDRARLGTTLGNALYSSTVAGVGGLGTVQLFKPQLQVWV